MAPDVAPGAVSGYQRLSLWWEAVPVPLPPRPALTQDLQVDVCIVGGGFTGLWTAHSLARADPALRVAVVEREVAGFGASGRNGGWCSALFATSDAALARLHGADAMHAMRRALQQTVDVVGASAAAEGIDCHFAKGGSVDLVRSEAQRARALAAVDQARALGIGEDDLRWLGSEETRQLVGAAGALGRDVHAALRGAAAGPPRPGSGGRGRATRRPASTSTRRSSRSGRARRRPARQS